MRQEGAPQTGQPFEVTGQLKVLANAGQDYPQIVSKQIASQTSNSIEVRDSNEVPLSGIDKIGNLFGGHNRAQVILGATTAAAITLTPAQSGAIVVSRTTSGAQVINLPTVAAGARVGMYYTVISKTGASVQIQLGTTDGAVVRANARTAGADAAAIASTATTGNVHNTTATMVGGDHLTVVFDGTDWLAVSQSGVWAAT